MGPKQNFFFYLYPLFNTKKKLWEWYGKAWTIHRPYVGMAWEDQGVSDDMELMRGVHLAICMLWEIYKKYP